MHWKPKGEADDWRVRINLTLRPDEDEATKNKHDSPHQQRVVAAEKQYRRCTKLNLLDSWDAIPEEDLPVAFTRDASDYQADVYTKAEFGCVLHETNSEE